MHSTDQVRRAMASSLADIIALSGEQEPTWLPEDLGAMLRHQLSAPVEPDLAKFDSELAERWRTLAAQEHFRWTRFGEVLQSQEPPLEGLRLVKAFARILRSHPATLLPCDIAAVLYFTSIAAALARCNERITKMDDASLRRGFQWGLDLPWIDADVRSVLREGLAWLERE